MAGRWTLAMPVLMLACGLTTAQDGSRYFNKREVSIPFNVPNDRDRIQEVQLYASLNGGGWTMVGRASPLQTRFRFTTDKDGAYDFAVKTLYIGGKSEPARNDQLQSARRVVVDTLAPQILARPFTGPNGAAGVEWEATDENIDPRSVRLEFRYPGQGDWAPIDRDKQFKPKDQQSWDLKGVKSGRMEIRVKARDLAGNEATSNITNTPPNGFDDRPIGRGAGNSRDELPPLRGAPELRPLDEGMRPNRDVPIGNAAGLLYVNGKEIKLEYDFRVGPSGYNASELYVRKPNGNWTKVENAMAANVNKEKENSLAIHYEADVEGLHGFFVRIQNKVDKWSDEPPARNTPARVEVMVDRTPPKVTMNPPKVRPAGDGSAIVDMAWLAEDGLSGLKPESVLIEYAAKPDSTEWGPVVDHQTGGGNYTWMVPAQAPAKLFLRVTAIDRAGNKGSFVLKDPVIVDLQRPVVDSVKADGGFRQLPP